MIVVADTSPINYLVQIDCANLLPDIYGRIILPQGVLEELSDTGAPSGVRGWIKAPPDWLETVPSPSHPDSKLDYLGKGEREAIQISVELRADVLLIDERKGRLEARRRGLRTTGTLGVLLAAAELQLIDAEMSFQRLKLETSFRASQEVESQFLAGVRSAKGK